MPYDARVFAQTAADENPTEGNVFDVSLLFEQIAVDLQNLLDNVKSVIFDIQVKDEGLTKNNKIAVFTRDILRIPQMNLERLIDL